MRLEIPYIPSRGFECGQTSVAMIIKFYYLKFEPNFDEFNNIVRHKKGMYTFPTQNALLLDHYNIVTKFYANEGLATTQEEPDLFKKTFGNEYDSNKDYIDVEIHDWAIEQCRKKNLFEQKVTEFTELLNEVEKEHVVIIPVDWNRLKNKIGTYQGHYVVICGIDANNIFLHDPDEGPYIKYPIEVVKNAWEHPAIADDYIVALGKK